MKLAMLLCGTRGRRMVQSQYLLRITVGSLKAISTPRRAKITENAKNGQKWLHAKCRCERRFRRIKLNPGCLSTYVSRTTRWLTHILTYIYMCVCGPAHVTSASRGEPPMPAGRYRIIYIRTRRYLSPPMRRAAHGDNQAPRVELNPTKSTLTVAFSAWHERCMILTPCCMFAKKNVKAAI